jgi:peptidoglycan/xylan/chitin deacetylase (PgdA/CDA1 family)
MARLLQLVSLLITLFMSSINPGVGLVSDEAMSMSIVRDEPVAEPTSTPDPPVVTNARHAVGPWPVLAAITEPIHIGYGASKTIHLGFDVEGSPVHLDRLLAVLDKHDVKTTMFVVGSWAERYPEWIQRFANDGHELANHTYSHSNLNELSAEQVLEEINQTEAIVQRLTNQSTKPWLRPPFGSRSEESIRVAYEAGWSTVIWSGSTNDWQQDSTSDDMLQTLLAGAYPGAILYSHTYRADIPYTVDRFIAEMHQQGYAFVPMSVLMSANPDAYLH